MFVELVWLKPHQNLNKIQHVASTSVFSVISIENISIILQLVLLGFLTRDLHLELLVSKCVSSFKTGQDLSMQSQTILGVVQ